MSTANRNQRYCRILLWASDISKRHYFEITAVIKPNVSP